MKKILKEITWKVVLLISGCLIITTIGASDANLISTTTLMVRLLIALGLALVSDVIRGGGSFA